MGILIRGVRATGDKTVPFTEKRGDGPYPWSVKWLLPGQLTEAGNQKYKRESGFADEETAHNHGLDMESDLRRGRYRDPQAGETLLREWVAEWRAKQRVSDRTIRNRDNSLDIHLLPAFGDKKLTEINWWLVSTWALDQPCARSSTNGRITLLSQILTAAVDARLIEYNPIWRRKLGGTPTKQPETVWSTAADVIAIAERLGQLADRYRLPNGRLRGNRRQFDRLAPMLSLLVYTIDGTGMRIGEALGLHRDNCGLWRRDVIDGKPWRRRVIRVDPDVGQWMEYYDRTTRTTVRRLGPPKPPNGAREIDIPDYLWTMLEAHMAAWPQPYLFCYPEPVVGADGKEHVEMFQASSVDHLLASVTDGRPERAEGQGFAAQPAQQPIRPGLSAHGLRHGLNTAMIELGTPEIMRCDRMGHSRKGIQGIYSHPTPAMRKRLLDALEERHRAALAAHGAPLSDEDHFPEFSQSITGRPRRKLRTG
jgi:integrase